MLETSLDICLVCHEDSLKIRIIDYTGTYESTLNPTGFGSPNYTVNDIISKTLVIILPNGDSHSVDITSLLPNLTGEDILLTYTDVTGLSGEEYVFEDGTYNFVYTLTFGEGEAEETVVFETTKFFYNTIQCAIMAELAKLPIPITKCCQADKDTLNFWFTAFTYLKSLQLLICESKLEEAEDILSMLQEYVKASNCGCN
jgi:hypothetical protein